MNIKMYKSQTDGSYSFKVYRDRKPIIIGNNFPSREACVSNIENALQAIRSNNMINIRSKEGGGGYLFSVGHADSCVFKSLDQASDGLAFLKEAVSKKQTLFASIDFEKERIISKQAIGQADEGYNFKQVSKTKKPGFELIDNDKLNLYYFHYNDSNGKPLFYSRAYDGKTRRIKAARSLVDLCKEKKLKKEFLSMKGGSGVVLILKSEEDIEIARSKIFKNKGQATDAFAQLQKEALGKVKYLKLPKKKKKKVKLPKKIYNLKAKAPSKKIGFVSFKDPKNKCHYFHFQDREGEALLYSTAFTSRKKRDSAIEKAIKLSPQKKLYAITSDEKKHFFLLQDEAGKGIAKSRIFDTQKKMIEGMRYFHANARTYAEKKNVVVEKISEQIPLNLNKAKSKPTKSRQETRQAKSQTNTTPSPVKEAPSSPPPPEKTATTNVSKKGQQPQPKQPQRQRQQTQQKGKPSPSKQPITSHQKSKQEAPKTSRTPQGKTPNNRQQSANANADKNTTRNTTRDNSKDRNTNKDRGATTNKGQDSRDGRGNREKRERNSRDRRDRNQGETTNRQRVNRKAPLKEVPEIQRESTRINPKTLNTPNKIHKPDPPKILPRGETPIPKFPWWKLLLSIIGLLLLFGLFRTCYGETGAISSDEPIPVEKTTKQEKPVKEVRPVEQLPTLLGPTSADLGFTKGSTAAKIANFLSLPASVLPKTFLLDKVHFPTNQEVFHQEAYDQLDRVAKLLLAYPKAIVQINGHTDNVGQPARNLQLSQERATFVRDYLVKKGLPVARITAKGYGDIEPIANNDTEIGRQANRRSEIVLLKR